ncbi:MAG TPA: hypothetical protein DCQ98_02970 [Planctomycetaceae bacterium]|nr:hypothetical protein [Planctomycetaceae bacterium]
MEASRNHASRSATRNACRRTAGRIGSFGTPARSTRCPLDDSTRMQASALDATRKYAHRALRCGSLMPIGLALITLLLLPIGALPAQETPGDWDRANAYERASSAEAATAVGETESDDALDGALQRPLDRSASRRRDASASPFAIPADVGRNTFLALATVVVLIIGAAWLMRKTQPRGFAALPREAVEVLGRVPLDARQQLQLVRLGRKLVLFGSGPQGVMPLSEVDDPQEVEELLTACRAGKSGSAVEGFRSLLQQAEREPTRGFLDRESSRGDDRGAGARSGQEPRETRRRRAWSES